MATTSNWYMANWTCRVCNREFRRETANPEKAKFCSVACYRAWRRDHINDYPHFPKGITPPFKGKKGIHLSPATEFKPGHTGTRRCDIGDVRMRRPRKETTPRAFVKIAEPNIWVLRAVDVWRKANGDIPPGMLVHHINGDTTDDRIENLALLTRAEHINAHRHHPTRPVRPFPSGREHSADALRPA